MAGPRLGTSLSPSVVYSDPIVRADCRKLRTADIMTAAYTIDLMIELTE